MLVCISAPLCAEIEKKHHNVLYSFGAYPIVGTALFNNYQYEYIFDGNTGISLNYIDIEHSNNLAPSLDYRVKVFTAKVTQYFQVGHNWSLFIAGSYGQATPRFSQAIKSSEDFMSEYYFDSERGATYSVGLRHNFANNFYWGIGIEQYKMGKYNPPVDVNFSLSYRF